MTIDLARDEVVDQRPDESGAGMVVVGRRGEGERLRADRVVIATGNPTPEEDFDDLRDDLDHAPTPAP